MQSRICEKVYWLNFEKGLLVKPFLGLHGGKWTAFLTLYEIISKNAKRYLSISVGHLYQIKEHLNVKFYKVKEI